ncbi:MAG TPA: Uma2 family endonuclease [Burkholderiaceae bacterium]
MNIDSIDKPPLAERLAKLPPRLTVYEYHQLATAGVLDEDDRVELIEGRLVAMSPIGSRHAGTVTLLVRLLSRAVGDRAWVWVGNPVALSDLSEPQPDLALLKPRPDPYIEALPQAADVLLLIEVADSSLRFDRAVKVPLYARHGIAEYWLIDVERRRVTVFSDPGEQGYRVEAEVVEGVLSAKLLPEARVRLDELFR